MCLICMLVMDTSSSLLVSSMAQSPTQAFLMSVLCHMAQWETAAMCCVWGLSSSIPQRRRQQGSRLQVQP